MGSKVESITITQLTSLGTRDETPLSSWEGNRFAWYIESRLGAFSSFVKFCAIENLFEAGIIQIIAFSAKFHLHYSPFELLCSLLSEGLLKPVPPNPGTPPQVPPDERDKNVDGIADAAGSSLEKVFPAEGIPQSPPPVVLLVPHVAPDSPGLLVPHVEPESKAKML